MSIKINTNIKLKEEFKEYLIENKLAISNTVNKIFDYYNESDRITEINDIYGVLWYSIGDKNSTKLNNGIREDELEKYLEIDEHPNSEIGDINSKEKGSGARYNSNKPDFSLLPLCTLEDEIRVWEYGAKKYAEWNWVKGMKHSIPFACAMRHLMKWQAGEDLDEETGFSHIAHAMCNLRMLTLYIKTFPEGDDRENNFLKEYIKNK